MNREALIETLKKYKNVGLAALSVAYFPFIYKLSSNCISCRDPHPLLAGVLAAASVAVASYMSLHEKT